MPTLGATVSTSTWPSAVAVQYVTPSDAATVTVNAGSNVAVVINPSGALTALTVAFNGSPSDGDLVTLSFGQVIATLTISGGTVLGALLAGALAVPASYLYSSTASKWFRV